MPASAEIMDADLAARIASRAYEIYEEGTHQGDPLQDWLRAKREVMALMAYEGKSVHTFGDLPPANPTTT